MQLEDVLCDLFPSDDPLDAKDFNVTGKVCINILREVWVSIGYFYKNILAF